MIHYKLKCISNVTRFFVVLQLHFKFSAKIGNKNERYKKLDGILMKYLFLGGGK